VVQDQLAQRISKLIQALNPDTLRRLLEASADAGERRTFVLNASQILAADAVLEVVEAAAHASRQTISHNLLRLLHKLAHHAEKGAAAIRAEADGALRTNVARLIADWDLEDPNPSQYNGILEGMVRRGSAEYSLIDLRSGCDPEVILKMAVELECVGPPVYGVIDALVSQRQLVRIAHLLEMGPQTSATEKIWLYLATPERLQMELAASPLDQEAVAILVDRIGTAAAEALLDRLASASDRSTRAAILKQLLALGPEVAPLAAARLPGAPWFVQRNILFLLGRLGPWPEGFSPREYAISPDARIRREAIKLMLDSADQHGEAVTLGLADSDSGIVGLALTAAVDGCPPAALPAAQRIAADAKLPSEARVLAIRILARSRTAEALPVLRDLVMPPRRWLAWRLAPKTPEVLAALSALASHWDQDPLAAEVLTRARQHSDQDIRAAANSTQHD
jgi:hypothetical protein